MAAGFIKEVFHPEWLANSVLLKKKGGKWRMCVDYTGLNKACPKVPYPLPRIDQIVDSTAGCETLSFLDAYSRYHQIRKNVQAYVDDIVVKSQEARTLIQDLEETFTSLNAMNLRLNPNGIVV